jgi:hypothetical protein
MTRLIAFCTVALAVVLGVPVVASAEGLIQVATSGGGAGTVVADSPATAPIDCPSACSSLWGTSRTITLVARPGADSMLGAWTVEPSAAVVAGCGTSTSCTVFVASAPDAILTGPGGFPIIVPLTAVLHVTATFVRNPDDVFLCYSKFQVDPGAWPATEAPALVAGGYWQPYAVLGTRSSTRLGAYSLVCNPPASAVVSGRDSVDSGGAVITGTRGALGLYPVARL